MKFTLKCPPHPRSEFELPRGFGPHVFIYTANGISKEREKMPKRALKKKASGVAGGEDAKEEACIVSLCN